MRPAEQRHGGAEGRREDPGCSKEASASEPTSRSGPKRCRKACAPPLTFGGVFEVGGQRKGGGQFGRAGGHQVAAFDPYDAPETVDLEADVDMHSFRKARQCCRVLVVGVSLFGAAPPCRRRFLGALQTTRWFDLSGALRQAPREASLWQHGSSLVVMPRSRLCLSTPGSKTRSIVMRRALESARRCDSRSRDMTST